MTSPFRSRSLDTPTPTFRWGRAGDDVLAEWPGILTLRATPAGVVKEIARTDGAPAEAFEKIRRGAANAFLRALVGKHSLHASAVVFEGEALACLGESGAGKSTMASNLCQAAGIELLADDLAAIDRREDRWEVMPSESHVWLSTAAGDTRSVKKAVAATAARRGAPLRWVIELRFEDSLAGPELRVLRGAERGRALLEAGVRLDITPGWLRSELDVADALASQAQVYQLTRPRRTTAPEAAHVVRRLMLGAPT